MGMQDEQEDPFETYAVVVNHEEQYSIWPVEKDLPGGWRAVGKEGSKKECLDHIEQVWSDMRPLSLRQQMEEWARNPPPAAADPGIPGGPSLVERLSAGEHPVSFSCRPERSAHTLKERLDMGYVHLKFTGTRGGTELGVRLDPGSSDWSQADFQSGSGTVRLAGDLTLDYERVRCVATLDLTTLDGVGRLERLGEAAVG
jgi:uncharacterized protein YbdZ (MbtH family)